jgi:formylglycine-generating enzyme required for sulfatase activity
VWSAAWVASLGVALAACGRGQLASRTAVETPGVDVDVGVDASVGVGVDASVHADAVAISPPDGMLLVSAGPFTMGADSGGQEDEHPAHTVALPAFWLDVTEVTNAKWDECVSANVCRPKSAAVRASHPDFDGPDLPVSGVSWDDARTYCKWRGKRLPRDLAGNVWEWAEDEYDPLAYRRSGAGEGVPGTCIEIRAALDELRRSDKQGFTGSNPIPTECEHSIRAGAYNYDAFGLRATNRVHHPGRYRIPMLGLRCAMDGPGIPLQGEDHHDAGKAQ